MIPLMTLLGVESSQTVLSFWQRRMSPLLLGSLGSPEIGTQMSFIPSGAHTRLPSGAVR